jgi:hypothetical protein
MPFLNLQKWQLIKIINRTRSEYSDTSYVCIGSCCLLFWHVPDIEYQIKHFILAGRIPKEAGNTVDKTKF